MRMPTSQLGPIAPAAQHRAGRLSPRSNAFTLIEVLIVAAIVVLMLGMALPVFHAITGSRSEAGASNIIASMLSRARTDAIGLNKPVGVAFIYNTAAQKASMAEVEFPDCEPWTIVTPNTPGTCCQVSLNGLAYYFYYVASTQSFTTVSTRGPAANTHDSGLWQWVAGPPLDIRPDTELVPLPTGIGVETISNCNTRTSGNTSVRLSDGYLAVGVILFDSNGRLTSSYYGIPKSGKLATAAGLTDGYPTHNYNGNIGMYTYSPTVSFSQFGVASQFGLVVFQQEGFQNYKSANPDSLYVDPTPMSSSTPLQDYSSGTPSQQTEETWLDQNATPLLIDRYTGTLIKAE